MKAPAQYSSQLIVYSANYPNESCLKTLNDTQSFREFGRLFQSVGPETAKLRGPERTEEHLVVIDLMIKLRKMGCVISIWLIFRRYQNDI